MDTDNYSEIGTLLRRAREGAQLTLDQAARQLHIRARYIEALEQGRLSDLPGVTYTRGYLQAYAVFLGLDKDEILRRFEQIESSLTKKGFYFPVVFSKQKNPDPTVIWGGLLAALFVYMLWLLVLQPTLLPISPVEPFPVQRQGIAHLSANMLQDVACLRADFVLYPPCSMAKPLDFSLLPLPGRINSVMELAKPNSR